jgi:hypothetical protein
MLWSLFVCNNLVFLYKRAFLFETGVHKMAFVRKLQGVA